MEERSPYSFLLCDLDVELRDLSLQKGLFQGLFDPDSYMIWVQIDVSQIGFYPTVIATSLVRKECPVLI